MTGPPIGLLRRCTAQPIVHPALYASPLKQRGTPLFVPRRRQGAPVAATMEPVKGSNRNPLWGGQTGLEYSRSLRRSKSWA